MREQGRVREACELLAPVYGWFTEGFDTKDLEEAKALLCALGEPARRETAERAAAAPDQSTTRGSRFPDEADGD
jgi:hypothetical protein